MTNQQMGKTQYLERLKKLYELGEVALPRTTIYTSRALPKSTSSLYELTPVPYQWLVWDMAKGSDV